MIQFKLFATGVVFLANLILLNPREISYDWLVTSFVVCIWIGFIGMIWGDELNRLFGRFKKEG